MTVHRLEAWPPRPCSDRLGNDQADAPPLHADRWQHCEIRMALVGFRDHRRHVIRCRRSAGRPPDQCPTVTRTSRPPSTCSTTACRTPITTTADEQEPPDVWRPLSVRGLLWRTVLCLHPLWHSFTSRPLAHPHGPRQCSAADLAAAACDHPFVDRAGSALTVARESSDPNDGTTHAVPFPERTLGPCHAPAQRSRSSSR